MKQAANQMTNMFVFGCVTCNAMFGARCFCPSQAIVAEAFRVKVLFCMCVVVCQTTPNGAKSKMGVRGTTCKRQFGVPS